MAFSSLTKDTPGSLLNIFKEIQRSLYPQFTIPQIFQHNNLTSWAKQGVLLLNTVLTVEEGLIGSHAGKGWETFTQHILQSLDNHPRNLVFFLWGKQAQQWEPILHNRHRHLVLKTSHPSPKSVDLGFRGCNHFVAAESFIRDDYLDIRTIIDHSGLENLIQKFGKEKNIIFDMNLVGRMPLGLIIPDIENKTTINLALE